MMRYTEFNMLANYSYLDDEFPYTHSANFERSTQTRITVNRIDLHTERSSNFTERLNPSNSVIHTSTSGNSS